MTPIYSCKSTIDGEGRLAYRITKFVDGNVESSYLTNGHTCDCPAGVRPTCRHRKMLPIMIAEDIVNTAFFLDYDGSGEVVDFDGNTVPASMREIAPAGLDGAPKANEVALPAELVAEPHSTTVSAPGFDPGDGGSNPPAVATPQQQSPHPWRRL